MLGQFLEYSVAARPLANSFEFYRALGFVDIPVGDTLPDPYLVLYDGTLAIGLHDRERPGNELTFVRPGLRDYVRALRRLDIELDYRHLGDQEFHRIGFTDPAGHAVTLLEARTFPPGDWNRDNVLACGEFLELSLPATDLTTSGGFWQSLGFTSVAAGEAPHPWQRLTGFGLTIGLHATHCRPGVTFRCTDLDARSEYFRAQGLAPHAGSPIADGAQRAATLTAPEGTVFYLLESGVQ